MDYNEESVKWLFVQRNMSFMYLAAAVCVIYDHFTTFDDEIALVWNRPKWSMVQYLYLINRYIGDALQIYTAYSYTKYVVGGTVKCSHHVSRLFSMHNNTNFSSPAYHIVSGYMLSVAALSMHGIMIYRVSSMYTHSRKIIALLVGALFIECVVVLAVQLASYSARIPVPSPAPGVLMCVQKSFPSWMYTLWFPIIFFETLIFSLSISLAVVYYKSLRHMAAMQQNSIREYFHHLDSLAYILLRDSITFPFLAVSVCIANLTVWYYFQQKHLFIQIAYVFADLTPCIFGPRLILNLREAYYQPFNRECTGMDELEVEIPEDPVDGLIIVTDANR